MAFTHDIKMKVTEHDGNKVNVLETSVFVSQIKIPVIVFACIAYKEHNALTYSTPRLTSLPFKVTPLIISIRVLVPT